MAWDQTGIDNSVKWLKLGGDPQDKHDVAVKGYLDIFGRPPTPQELAIAEPQYEGPNGNAFVASLYQQQQAQKNAPQQEADQIKAQIPIINDLVSNQMQGQIKNLTDPNSDAYKSFAGNLNNLGITPSSGAFQAGLGNEIGRASADFTGQALGQIGLPIAGAFSQGQTVPYTQSIQQPYQLQQQGYDWQQFNAQEQLAKQLGEAAQPSGTQQGLGTAFSGLQGAGGFLEGAGAAKKSGLTYICTHLKNIGLATEEEVSLVHKKLIPTMVTHPLAWIHYWMRAQELIKTADLQGVDWNQVKKNLIDDIISEPDREKAFQHYKTTCISMCMDYAPELMAVVL